MKLDEDPKSLLRSYAHRASSGFAWGTDRSQLRDDAIRIRNAYRKAQEIGAGRKASEVATTETVAGLAPV
jgi:hypothetical protein